VPEVTHVHRRVFWLLVDARELFLAFDDFPWFRDSRSRDLLHVERHGPDHLRWPGLDVDLSLRSIEEPSAFPLVSRERIRRRRVARRSRRSSSSTRRSA
jgi:hypothetical protein